MKGLNHVVHITNLYPITAGIQDGSVKTHIFMAHRAFNFKHN